MTSRSVRWVQPVALTAALLAAPALASDAQAIASDEKYEREETRALVTLVRQAADLVRAEGESAFDDLRVAGSRWRDGETYVFVLDLEGNMLVHADPALEGKNQLDLEDINGKPIIRGLIAAVTAVPAKTDGWYHYEWPVPGGLLPRWKSTYVRLVEAPTGKRYVVGSGVYDDRMERAFVIDIVDAAAARIEKEGVNAFGLLRDRTGPFIAKDAYVFVVDPSGVEVVNPAFPNLEGRNLLDVEDVQGKPLIREMIDVVRARGSGWVDYMWPKPGDNVPTQKSAYVKKAKLGDDWVLVGCGVYLADAVESAEPATKMTATELMALVREAAAILERDGEAAYPTFRERGSKWLHDDTYVFVWTMDGTRVFHGADPQDEGQKVSGLKDVLGRPYGKMFLDVAAALSGEGWVHYMRPEPGDIFPTWKSTFVKRVTFPSGAPHLVGCGIYDMHVEQSFIEDVVDRAAALVAARGEGAFAELRDEIGPYVFMDTYVFVDRPDGVELVNPAQPSLEGKDLSGMKDAKGKAAVDEYIALAMKNGNAWTEYYWYRPGSNTPVRKKTYVRKVGSGEHMYIVGSGLYVD